MSSLQLAAGKNFENKDPVASIAIGFLFYPSRFLKL